ncbi:hypothetical protein [Streptomyces kronopolitis]|uniref:hypothetical protein n=1 Tax=Streptomyces kronopolitis TaxID=1612435 RepID=UPI003D9527C1
MINPFAPPIDLSHLPNYRQADARPRRAVFLGRVSTKDRQLPASSIPRQVVLAAERLDPGEEFIAHFWDVESGMLPAHLRGLGPQEMYDGLGVPTPRDGGLQDLVDRAGQMGITHVLAERSDRVARAMLTSLTVEHELERLGAEVIYANEPTGGTESGRLRTRRYGQAEAEIYRATMIEMSMGGQFQHAIGGWNHGYPPYPYVAVVDEDAPVRGDAAEEEARSAPRRAPVRSRPGAVPSTVRGTPEGCGHHHHLGVGARPVSDRGPMDAQPCGGVDRESEAQRLSGVQPQVEQDGPPRLLPAEPHFPVGVVAEGSCTSRW